MGSLVSHHFLFCRLFSCTTSELEYLHGRSDLSASCDPPPPTHSTATVLGVTAVRQHVALGVGADRRLVLKSEKRTRLNRTAACRDLDRVTVSLWAAPVGVHVAAPVGVHVGLLSGVERSHESVDVCHRALNLLLACFILSDNNVLTNARKSADSALRWELFTAGFGEQPIMESA